MIGTLFDGVHELPLFVAAGLLLNVTPGADMALIGARSALQGFRVGAAAALGVGAGCFVHVAAGALGLSALIAGSATAFTLLRWLDAAYLVWLGIGLLRGGTSHASAQGSPALLPVGVRPAFAQGFLTNALNPKVALFFLAFLPQFVDPASPHPTRDLAALGVLYALLGLPVKVGVALAAGGLAQRFARSRAAGLWLNRASGTILVALGLKLAATERP